MTDNVNHPSHYKRNGPECIDAIEAALSEEEFRGFVKGTVIAYLWREKYKGKDEDILKAQWYINRLDRYIDLKKKYPAG